MKLIDSIKSVIYEQLDDYEDVEKLFGGDIKSIFNFYRKNNQLEELLQLLDYEPLRLVPTLIDTGDKKYEELAWKLVKPYLDGDIIREGGKYILSLKDREDVTKLFQGSTGWSNTQCKDIAELVFQEDLWDSWEPHRTNEHMTYLLGALNDKNYQELVTSLIENYGNKEITHFREEFEGWVNMDKLEDALGFHAKSFILTPDRILETSKDRYNFAILLSSIDLEDFEKVIGNIYDKAYNDVIVSEYFNGYHQAVNNILGDGKDVQRGTQTGYKRDSHEKITVPVYKYEFDVTDKFWNVIKYYAEKTGQLEIDEYGWFDTLTTIMNDYNYKGGLLCPDIDEYPDEDEVENVFNDIFIEELGFNL